MNKEPLSSGRNTTPFFERWGGPTVESNHWRLGFWFMMAVVFVLVYVILSMMPLKTVAPYMITVNKDTGAVQAEPVAAENFTPDENMKRYFLKQWVTKIFTLDKYLTEKYLIEAYDLCRNEAANEFSAFVDKEKHIYTLKTQPELSQSVEIRSVSFLQDGGALVRVQLAKRSPTEAPKLFDKVITIHYSVVPPQTEQDVYKNPIGIYITHFAISEDIS